MSLSSLYDIYCQNIRQHDFKQVLYRDDVHTRQSANTVKVCIIEGLRSVCIGLYEPGHTVDVLDELPELLGEVVHAPPDHRAVRGHGVGADTPTVHVLVVDTSLEQASCVVPGC